MNHLRKAVCEPSKIKECQRQVLFTNPREGTILSHDYCHGFSFTANYLNKNKNDGICHISHKIPLLLIPR